MQNFKILIAGYGVVGKHLYEELSVFNPDIFDKYMRLDNRRNSHYDFVFICVDTPLDDEYPTCLDTTEVNLTLQENSADVYVIKSTCPLGFTSCAKFATDKHIVYSPEYYGDTPHCTKQDFNFTILGGDDQDCIAVQQLLQYCYDASHKFYITDSTTAELVKFMENSWIATKVSFCTQFYEIAKQHNIDYEKLRELFIADPRVNPSHTFVYRDTPYWDSKCLNKDVIDIANSEESATLLSDIIKYNNIQKERYKDATGNTEHI